MDLTVTLCIVIALFSHMVIYYDGVQGKSLSRKDKDIDKQLKLLNKPFVKTIKTAHGEIYDCVDFYKQPAFDHPLLKNHSFHPEMRPNFSSTRATSKSGVNYNSENKSPRSILDCPKGTVPIKRVTKDDLIRIKPLMEQFTSRRATPKGIQIEQGTSLHHFAISQTVSTPSPEKIRGFGATLNVYNPTIGPSQYTSGEIVIQNNGDTLKAGWMVNHGVYNDSLPHSFAYLKVGDKTCFNTQCPGFIVTSSKVPVDMVYEDVSTRGAAPLVDKYFIYQDERKDKWWLDYSSGHIGFWPTKILSDLKDAGTYIACGGETFSPDGAIVPMGSSFRPVGDTWQDGYCADMTIVDGSFKAGSAKNLEPFVDDNTQYEVKDLGSGGDMGHVIVYGGPL